MGMGAPSSCARLYWRDRIAQGRDSSFCGACRQAGAAGMPRGHVRAALQISKSHLADKNLFGPPTYCSVCPPSPAPPFPARQAPQRYPSAPIVTVHDTWTSGWKTSPDTLSGMDPKGNGHHQSPA